MVIFSSKYVKSNIFAFEIKKQPGTVWNVCNQGMFSTKNKKQHTCSFCLWVVIDCCFGRKKWCPRKIVALLFHRVARRSSTFLFCITVLPAWAFSVSAKHHAKLYSFARLSQALLYGYSWIFSQPKNELRNVFNDIDGFRLYFLGKMKKCFNPLTERSWITVVCVIVVTFQI